MQSELHLAMPFEIENFDTSTLLLTWRTKRYDATLPSEYLSLPPP